MAQTKESSSLDDLLRARIGDLLRIADPENDLELAGIVEAGLPTASIDSLIKRGLPEAFLFETVVPRRTYHRRRERNERLTADESDRAERAARAFALASFVFDDEPRAALWLTTPKRQFSDRAPLELMKTKVGSDIVEQSLLQSYYGIIA